MNNDPFTSPVSTEYAKPVLNSACVSYQARYQFSGLFPITVPSLQYEKRYKIPLRIPTMTLLYYFEYLRYVQESYSTSTWIHIIALKHIGGCCVLGISNFRPPPQGEEERERIKPILLSLPPFCYQGVTTRESYL